MTIDGPGGARGGIDGSQAGDPPVGVAPAGGVAPTEEGRTIADRGPGPAWRGWVLSILAAVILSVAATLLFGGSIRLAPPSPPASGQAGAGDPCCPPPKR